MAIMMGSRCKALVEGGISHDAAKRAAEIADHQKPLVDVRPDPTVVKAMSGILIAGVAALVMHAFG